MRYCTDFLHMHIAEHQLAAAELLEHSGRFRERDCPVLRGMSERRRSRMQRTRNGKRIVLTERDLKIFRALAAYRYLRSTYLHAFAGGASETRFKERLGDLFHEGFIERPAKQWEYANARCVPAVYEIGEGARRVLAEEECAGNNARTVLSATAHKQFAHSLMICECLASIELAIQTTPGLRFISWPEILVRVPETTRTSPMPFRLPLAPAPVVPDGIFGIEYTLDAKHVYRFFAVEADRGTMPVARGDKRRTSLMGKLTAYQEVLARGVHRSHLGIPNLLILILTTSSARMDCALTGAGSAPWALFKAAEPRSLLRPVPGLLSGPWDRAGFPPLRIGESG